MAETIIKRRRGDPLMDYDIVTGTVAITIPSGAVTANSANITFDPLQEGTPLLIGTTLAVVRTGVDSTVSVEVLTLNSTTLAFTGKCSVDPAGGNSTVITVRYTLLCKIRNS